jgi:hypothetical protein
MFLDLKTILHKNVKKAPIYRQLEAAQIIEIFHQYVRQAIPGHLSGQVKGLYVKNQILHVASLSSLLAQELRFKESEIIKIINTQMQRPVLKKIRFIA